MVIGISTVRLKATSLVGLDKSISCKEKSNKQEKIPKRKCYNAPHVCKGSLPKARCFKVKSCLKSSSSTTDRSESFVTVSSCDSELFDSSFGSLSSVSTPSKNKKSVSFDIVEVREYPPTASSNPSVNGGVGVQLNWRHIDEAVHSINEFEGERLLRSTSSSFMGSNSCGVPKLAAFERKRMLLRHGWTLDGLKIIEKEADKVRTQRSKTLEKIRKDMVTCHPYDIRSFFCTASPRRRAVKRKTNFAADSSSQLAATI